MTHSGQGDEQRPPAARPAHEGVVLPADGSEPLIPGTQGAQAAPAGGQPWGAPWGPQQPGGQQPPAAPGYGAQQPPAYGYPGGPAPDAAVPGYGYPAPDGYGAPAPGGGYGYPPQQPAAYGQQPPAAPGYGGQQPPAEAGYGAQQPPAYGYPGGPAPQGQGHPGAALPLPQQGAPGGYDDRTQMLPPQSGGVPGGYPVPGGQGPGGASDATQYIAPVAGGQGPGGASDATQYIAPVAGGQGPGGASDATQYIAPVPGGQGPGGATPPGALPGALPPEVPAESTTFLGTGPLAQGGGPGGGAPGGDTDATQYIAPVPPEPAAAPFGIRPGAPGDRQPPSEFDSLFRSDAPPAAHGGADSTQQMPHLAGGQPGPGSRTGMPQQGFQEPGHPRPGYDDEPPARRRSLVPVVAALVVGCAVLGLGVSAVVFGGDDSSSKTPDENVAATSAAPSPSASEKPADPAKPQAEALDKLLADSNDSRAAVIRSVENTKSCKDLDAAVKDLKDAAAQRRGLVTRLGELELDKLPKHAELNSALTKAWQASASADDHYAAWAQQAKSKKVCKDGKARSTSHTAQGNKASGDATRAKNQAAQLWNAIARDHGLTERRSEQL
ncbi:hypothetical protein [Streptomyces genisteinicus]|uniref:Uncharacterized protein n=1 Tax=Streptomyces genisteinicus TaxID=2768068 RepID=A0A7H0HTG2_9ACTN|nr:hypothetical protein [Streptomyces genisteinicus]QNP63828.1 hypothetical protein IAG43_13405 [Streptomyces genisteinicus]